MPRWVVHDAYPTNVLLETKNGLKIGREIHSVIKYLCGGGMVGNWHMNVGLPTDNIWYTSC